MADVIDLLLEDHARFRQELEALESAPPERREELFRRLRGALVQHEVAEEEVVYPELRSTEQGTSIAERRVGEEAVAEEILRELDLLHPSGEIFAAKLAQLRRDVLFHAGNEEREVFPFLRSTLSEERRAEMGALLELAKDTAPTRPHPAAPDRPPGNVVLGALAAVVDRGRDRLERVRGG